MRSGAFETSRRGTIKNRSSPRARRTGALGLEVLTFFVSRYHFSIFFLLVWTILTVIKKSTFYLVNKSRREQKNRYNNYFGIDISITLKEEPYGIIFCATSKHLSPKAMKGPSALKTLFNNSRNEKASRPDIYVTSKATWTNSFHTLSRYIISYWNRTHCSRHIHTHMWSQHLNKSLFVNESPWLCKTFRSFAMNYTRWKHLKPIQMPKLRKKKKLKSKIFPWVCQIHTSTTKMSSKCIN